MTSGLKVCISEGIADRGAAPTLATCGQQTAAANSTVTNANTGTYVDTITCNACDNATAVSAAAPVLLVATFKAVGVSTKLSGNTISLGTNDGTTYVCGTNTSVAVAGLAALTDVDAKLLPSTCKD